MLKGVEFGTEFLEERDLIGPFRVQFIQRARVADGAPVTDPRKREGHRVVEFRGQRREPVALILQDGLHRRQCIHAGHGALRRGPPPPAPQRRGRPAGRVVGQAEIDGQPPVAQTRKGHREEKRPVADANRVADAGGGARLQPLPQAALARGERLGGGTVVGVPAG